MLLVEHFDEQTQKEIKKSSHKMPFHHQLGNLAQKTSQYRWYGTVKPYFQMFYNIFIGLGIFNFGEHYAPSLSQALQKEMGGK